MKFLLMTSHRDSHTTTDVKKVIIPGVQTGNGIPHDKYNIRTHMRAHTEKTTFDIFMQTQLNISWFE